MNNLKSENKRLLGDILRDTFVIVKQQPEPEYKDVFDSLKEQELLYVTPLDLSNLKSMHYVNMIARRLPQINSIEMEMSSLYTNIVCQLEQYVFNKLYTEKVNYIGMDISEYLHGYKDASLSNLYKNIKEHSSFLDTVKDLKDIIDIKIHNEIYRDMVTPDLQSFELHINDNLKERNTLGYEYNTSKEFNLHNIGKIFDVSNDNKIEIQKFIKENIKKFNEDLEVSFEDNPFGMLYNIKTNEIITFNLFPKHNNGVYGENRILVSLVEIKHIMSDGKIKIDYMAQKIIFNNMRPQMFIPILSVDYNMFTNYDLNRMDTNPSILIEKVLNKSKCFKINNVDLDTIDYETRVAIIDKLLSDDTKEKFIEDIIRFIISSNITNIEDVYYYIVESELFKSYEYRLNNKIPIQDMCSNSRQMVAPIPFNNGGFGTRNSR